jgi:quercetin dioxygenase-like cupin family protein
MAHEGQLPKINRFITTHDQTSGHAIFSTALPDESKMRPLPDNMGFALSYTTTGFPISTAGDADIASYKEFLATAPGLTVSGGTVLRHVDFVPGVTCAMHRTVSVDYGVVLEGEMECVLDSGERRTLRRGDVCVQRGTMHAWRNTSGTEWARMLFVLLPCVEVEVAGRVLGEELGTAVGIRESS